MPKDTRDTQCQVFESHYNETAWLGDPFCMGEADLAWVAKAASRASLLKLMADRCRKSGPDGFTLALLTPAGYQMQSHNDRRVVYRSSLNKSDAWCYGRTFRALAPTRSDERYSQKVSQPIAPPPDSFLVPSFNSCSLPERYNLANLWYELQREAREGLENKKVADLRAQNYSRVVMEMTLSSVETPLFGSVLSGGHAFRICPQTSAANSHLIPLDLACFPTRGTVLPFPLPTLRPSSRVRTSGCASTDLGTAGGDGDESTCGGIAYRAPRPHISRGHGGRLRLVPFRRKWSVVRSLLSPHFANGNGQVNSANYDDELQRRGPLTSGGNPVAYLQARFLSPVPSLPNLHSGSIENAQALYHSIPSLLELTIGM
ncbi:hypothetical protein BDK51DRAFT_49254 [Blyttiomyces helicus]|uniref:Uncharacterized protein n=1 Tax=Blyttiomyces helicus TaxID=388810 RepID=A0A4P9WN39_9FUNG|nr:hypothetical protein BDK51DRAFT_49254 [Blyttiomyces helicus]|eukprot:RKO93665.1 hypothetical protein BDK51DRAFT_49254 [Blyttiomyces helicus]